MATETKKVPQEALLDELGDAVSSSRSDRAQMDYHLGRAETAIRVLPTFPLGPEHRTSYAAKITECAASLRDYEAPVYQELRAKLVRLAEMLRETGNDRGDETTSRSLWGSYYPEMHWPDD